MDVATQLTVLRDNFDQYIAIIIAVWYTESVSPFAGS
jgi:hypothetical protein